MEGKYVAYVGTYTHENSVGIHIYDVDELRGTLTERKVIPINNPSDLIVSHSGKYLYSIADEGVEAFAIQPDGDLIPINKKWIGGMRGCYVELDDEDRYDDSHDQRPAVADEHFRSLAENVVQEKWDQSSDRNCGQNRHFHIARQVEQRPEHRTGRDAITR